MAKSKKTENGFPFKRKIFVFTNIAPHYRKQIWQRLLDSDEFDIHFFFGQNSQSGIPTIDIENWADGRYQACLHRLKNFWYKGKVLFWQQGVVLRFLRKPPKTAVFLGDMYVLSTWISSIVCRCRGVEVVFWGHGIYGNESRNKLFWRRLFYKLADKHLLYERRAKKLMVEQSFKPDNLYVVFNSLNYDRQVILRDEFKSHRKTEVFSSLADASLPVLIFVGRLTEEKKLSLLIDAVFAMNSEMPRYSLIIVGTGPEHHNLLKKASSGISAGWIHFVGECYDEEKVGEYLFASDLCVSPGNIGLTAIHSLNLGTPVCTHQNLSNQCPEAEAVSHGYNGFFFEEDSLDSLIDGIHSWFESCGSREEIRKKCYEIVDAYYNPEFQYSVFKRLFDNLPPEI